MSEAHDRPGQLPERRPHAPLRGAGLLASLPAVPVRLRGARAGPLPHGDLLAARPQLLHHAADTTTVFLIGISVLVTLCVFNVVPGTPPAAVTVADARGVRRRARVRARASARAARSGSPARSWSSILLAEAPGRRVGLPHLPTNADPRLDLHRRVHPDRGAARPEPVGAALAAGVPGGALRLPLRASRAGALRRVALRAGPPTDTSEDDGTFSDGFIGLNHQLLTIFNLHDFGRPTADIAGFVRGRERLPVRPPRGAGGHGLHRVRLHVSLPELVLEDVHHPMARDPAVALRSRWSWCGWPRWRCSSTTTDSAYSGCSS